MKHADVTLHNFQIHRSSSVLLNRNGACLPTHVVIHFHLVDTFSYTYL